MANTDLDIKVEADVDVSELDKIGDEIDQITDDLDDMAKELADVADAADDAEGELTKLGKAGAGLKGLGNIAGGLLGGLAGIGGIIGQAVGATQDWVLSMDNLSKTTGATVEEATALAVSFELAGFAAADAESFISGFQGRLIDELEAQKEAAKEIASIQKERVDLLKEMDDAEADHLSNLADLEAERADINSEGSAERRAQQQEELSDLRKDHDRFLQDQRGAEERENQQFEEIWEERTRIFEEKSEKLRNDLTDKSRSARNVRDFLAAQDEFADKQKLLQDDLKEGNDKQLSANEQRIADLKATTEQEKNLFNERTAAVNKAADEDVAKQEEANAKALASLESRIEAEKEAFTDRTEGFNDQLGSLAEAQAEAQDAGGGLLFMFKELGIEAFNTDGTLKTSVDLIFEMQEAMRGLEDEGAKAAFLADLGLDAENAAFWMTEGASATEALQFAQEKGLVPTKDSIEAIREQNRLMAELKLSLLGAGVEAGLAEAPMNILSFAMEKTNDAIAIAQGLWSQLTDIAGLLFERIGESEVFQSLIDGLEKVKDLVLEAFENFKMLTSILGTEGGLGSLLGNIVGSILPEFATGTRSVPGTGKQLAIVDGGEEIRSRSQVLASKSSAGNGSGSGVQVIINGDVNGVDDLQAAIVGALRQADMQSVGAGVGA